MTLNTISAGSLWLAYALFVVGVVTQRFAMLPTKAAVAVLALGLLIATVVAALGLVLWLLKFTGAYQPVRDSTLIFICLGAIPLALIVTMVGLTGFKAPPIHDISTSPDAALRFVHVPSLRQGSDNAIVPPPQKTIDLQRAHYLELKPLVVQAPATELFQRIKTVVNQPGWEVVYDSEQDLRLEVVITTPLMNFKDDLLIQLSELEQGVQVDMRSVSRVGVSDLGANAERIRRLQAAVVSVVSGSSGVSGR